jgi:hypothetical protein
VHNNKLILLTKKGILQFSIEHLPPKISPRFYVNSITAGGINFNIDKELILTHTQKNISIHYSVLDYGERGYETMYYTINGSEKFALPENANRLELPMLAEGKYLIDFYLDDQKLPYPLSITILPPIWKRWWFNTLLSIIIITLIYLYYRYQNGLLQKKV